MGKGDVVGHTAVGEIEVVGLGGIFCRKGVYLLHHRQDAQLLTTLAHGKHGIVHVQRLLQTQGAGYLEVAEAIDLGLAQELGVERGEAAAFVKLVVKVADVLELVEEPLVYLRQVVDLVDGVTLAQGFGDDEDTLVRGFAQSRIDVLDFQLLILHETVHPLPYHAQTLLDGFLEGATDGHHLAHRLHAAAQLAIDAAELAQVPTGNLADDIVDGGLEEGRRGLGDGVLQVEESIAEAQLAGYEGKRIARGLAG